MKPITIAIAGCGSRGMQAYAPPGQALFPGRMRIVAAADIRPGQLALMRERYGLTQALLLLGCPAVGDYGFAVRHVVVPSLLNNEFKK